MSRKGPDKSRETFRPSRRNLLAGLGAAGLAGATSGLRPAGAQAHWLDKPGRMVVGYTPGTSTDSFARMLASQYQAQSGHAYVVENRPGASGWTATLAVTKAAPDGSVLTFNANGIAIYGLVQKNSFDATVDLTPIGMVARSPVALLITSSLPVKTIPEFVAYAKNNEIFYGSSGQGSAVHLYTELFCQRAGIAMKHVTYRGIGDALPDFIAGRIQILFSSYATGAGMIKSGQCRLLAYAADGWPPGTPDAPTVRSAGIDYEATNWWAVFGPAGMTADRQQRINDSTSKALADPAFARLFQTAGVVGSPMKVDEFTREVKRQYIDLKAVVEAAKITFD